MRIEVGEEELRVRLAPWQKLLGLMGDIRIPRTQVRSARVLSDPVREAMHAGIKVGLRLPWLYFVARTIRLDEAFVVRRGVPALCLDVEGPGALRRVLVSTRRAEELARALAG